MINEQSTNVYVKSSHVITQKKKNDTKTGWIFRKKLFSKRAVRHCHCCPGGGGVTSFGGVPDCGDVALGDMVSGHGGMGWTWGSEKSFPT